MKKIICISLLVIFSLPFALAQKTTEKVQMFISEAFNTDGQMFEAFIGADKTGVYTVRSKSKVYNIEHFNKNFKLVNKQKLNFKVKNKYRKPEKFLLYKDVIYIFSSFSDSKTKQYYLYVEKYDKLSLKQIGEITEVIVIDYSKTGQLDSGLFITTLSSDSTKILIYCLLPIVEKGFERVSITSYDIEIEEFWSKEIIIPYEDRLFTPRDFIIDNDGNIYLIGTVFTDNELLLSVPEINYYTILAYYDNDKEVKLVEYPIMIQDKIITDMKIKILSNQDIICAGFYSNGYSAVKTIVGSYYIRINNETKSIENQNFNEFDMGFIKPYSTEKDRSVELENYYLDKIVIREDGSVILIAEQAYMESHQSSSTSSVMAKYYVNNITTWSNNNILIVNYDSDGVIEWSREIEKKQASKYVTDSKLSISSYHLHLKGDKTYFIYNIRHKNLTLDKEFRQCAENMERGESFVVYCEIDKNGKIEKDCIIKVKERRHYPTPIVSVQVSVDESLIYAYIGESWRMIRLIFE